MSIAGNIIVDEIKKHKHELENADLDDVYDRLFKRGKYEKVRS